MSEIIELTESSVCSPTSESEHRSESAESNGSAIANGTAPANANAAGDGKGKKRASNKDLNARIDELERKISAASEIDKKIASLTDEIVKLGERVTKIAVAVAQSNFAR
jgi:small-conductance mechanosensitive channel